MSDPGQEALRLEPSTTDTARRLRRIRHGPYFVPFDGVDSSPFANRSITTIGFTEGAAPLIRRFMMVRDEMDGDRAVIAAVTSAAFEGHPYSAGTEAAIVEGLRRASALTLSLVAEEDGAVVGHVAFSPVEIGGGDGSGWYGLGPLSVRPDRQRCGIGTQLVRAGLARMQDLGARGCVLVGNPGYYSRYGFERCPRLTYDGVPPEYFMALWFDGPLPEGAVRFHSAFGAH